MFQQIRKMSEPAASLLLLLLLSADAVFFGLQIIIGTFAPDSDLCNTLGICAYMDSYHLIKIFWIVILLFYLLKLTKHYGYAAWALMFSCFFIDDAFWLHQKIGDRIATLFAGYDLPPRFYELAVLATAGLILLAFIIWFYLRGAITFRKISGDIFLFLAALVFFGLIVDIAEMIGLGHSVITGLEYVEDGGELVVYSLIVWYVYLLVLRQGQPEMFLVDKLPKRFISSPT